MRNAYLFYYAAIGAVILVGLIQAPIHTIALTTCCFLFWRHVASCDRRKPK
jgi:hypothetical protein